jgi:amidase
VNAIFKQFKVDNKSTSGAGYLVAVKDTIDVAGFSTVAGSSALVNAAPAEKSATVVTALARAGCELLGKTNLHELAYGMSGVNHWAGTPTNVKFPNLIPGGSSSGSAAAVASQLVDFSLGTDTGGSIRLPATCCGVYGLKPTYGRVSREGVKPTKSSLDCVGPFANTPEMLIAAMEVIDPTFVKSRPVGLSEITLGSLTVGAEVAILSGLDDFLKISGVKLQQKTLPLMSSAFSAGMTLINRETWEAFGYLLDSGLLGQDVENRLRHAKTTTDSEVAFAGSIRERFSAEVDKALASVSALVLPTLPTFPMTLSDALEGKVDLNMSSLIRPFNLSGHPALSIPLLTERLAGPVGIQLVGRKGEDELLCEIARKLSPFLPNT